MPRRTSQRTSGDGTAPMLSSRPAASLSAGGRSLAFAYRSGHWSLRVRRCWRCSVDLERQLVRVAPPPVLAGFVGPDYRMVMVRQPNARSRAGLARSHSSRRGRSACTNAGAPSAPPCVDSPRNRRSTARRLRRPSRGVCKFPWQFLSVAEWSCSLQLRALAGDHHSAIKTMTYLPHIDGRNISS